MILVTGAGGTVGSEVVRKLQSIGAKFRAAFHSESKAQAARAKGVDAVVIDYDKPETLRAALSGVERVFVLSSGNPQHELNTVEAAKASGVKHIVKLSVAGADGEAYIFARMHRSVERAIEASGMAWTHLRPTSFMQNLATYSGATINSQGAFYSSVGDSKMNHVDVRDVAAVAAKALTEPGHEGQAYTIAGPEVLTYDEVAAKLSAAAGRTISYVNVTDDDMRAGMAGMGAPPAYIDAYADLLRQIRTGGMAHVTSDVKKVTGQEPRSFDQYAKDNAAAFK